MHMHNIPEDADMTDDGYKFKAGDQLQHSISDEEYHTLNKPADADMKRDSELQETTYQIQKYTTTEFVVGAKTGRACDIIARFNNEDAANEYCNSQAIIDRQAQEIEFLTVEHERARKDAYLLPFVTARMERLKIDRHNLSLCVDRQAEEIARIRAEHAGEIGILNDKCVVMRRSRDQEIAQLRDENEKFRKE